jgi:hypothetical protein
MRSRFVRYWLLTVILATFGTASASASTIWTNWTEAQTGAPGFASGTVAGVTVRYNGELGGFVLNGASPIWSPNASFIGGTVDTSPSSVGDDLRLVGSAGLTNIVTFSQAVTNPVFAFWSLGQPGLQAAFMFTITPTFEAGGPNSNFGGGPIVVVGNNVLGSEGNGVVQFTGTFTQIQWTNTPENFYAFTVGVNGPAAVPEPVSLVLVGTGVAGLLARRRARR